MPNTATISDVELVSVGTWAASTGVTKVTRPDLEAMLAAHADGLVDHAPVKLGHESSLNNDLGDGAPAYGWVVPTRIGVNASGRDTLYGDLVGMPSKLAEVAPTAYRRRSVEIAWGVTTPKGDKYAAALVGIALLGASAPAVKGLADVLALYSTEPQVDRISAIELVEGLEENTMAVAMLTAARQLGTPVEQLDALAEAAGARDTADVPPPVEDPDNDDQQTTTPGAPADGRNTMPQLTDEQIREALKLEADADVNAALTGILAERGASTATPGADPANPTNPEGQPATDPATPGTPAPQSTPQGEPNGEPAGAATPEVVTLSAATHRELTALAEETRRSRRANALNDAVRSGRITPAERGSLSHETQDATQVTGFAAAIERDEDGTIALLSSMAPRFAVQEFGDDRAANADLSAAQATAYDDFEASVFPELARVRNQS